MSAQERKLPHAHTVDSLIRGYAAVRVNPFSKSEIGTIEEQFQGCNKTSLEVAQLILDNMFVRPETRMNGVAFFLLESPKQGYRTKFERHLHTLFNLRTEEATRILIDAANERDILDLQVQLSRIGLDREYNTAVWYAQIQVDDLEQQLHERVEFRRKIRERISPSTPQTRA